MSALTRALEALTPGAVLRNLAAYLGKSAPHLHSEARGEVCDFRPGQEEENPSLSYKAGNGGPIFHRFGGDGFGSDERKGGTLAFLESAGIPREEAKRLIFEWAGVKDEPGERGTVPSSRPAPVDPKAARLAKADAALSKLRPLEAGNHGAALRGWERLQAGDTHPEALELARRGLTPALASGLLTAYRWTGKVQGGKARPLSRHILPGAVAFEVTGPDGTPWAVKARNPGDKAAIKAANTQRYVYVGRGQSTPAMCGPGQEGAARFLIVEGELNAVACLLMLGAVAPLEAARGWAVQGVASASALPHVAHLPAGAQVYVYADPDEEGEAARTKWAELLTARGCQVFQVGGDVSPFAVEGKADADACDALGTVGQGADPEGHAAHVGARLLEAVEAARPWKPEPAQEDAAQVTGEDRPAWCEPGDVPTGPRMAYGVRGGKLAALTLKKEDGEEWVSPETLADFTAFITAEVIEEDGSGDARRVFQIEGHRPDGAPLFPPTVTVTTAEFSGMAWPVAKWGGEARLPAGNGKKDKARDAVQVLSNARGYPRRTVYQHTGWIQHPEHGPVYLSAGAVIGARGGVPGVSVELTGRLSAYALPDPVRLEDGTPRPAEDLRAAVRASLALLELAPDTVGVPLLGAAYRAALGQADFVVWTVGETGRHKTAFMGLVMAHYGARWGRKFLPDGWNSSANALESNAFRVKDALFVIDDFKPSGSAGDRAKMDGTARRIISGQADGAGRATLTADRKTRVALYPRGLIASSAEDLPRVHSDRARLVMVEVLRPLIDSDPKSKAYYRGEENGVNGVYALALAGFIQGAAASWDAVRAGGAAHGARVRALSAHFQGAHGRTGDNNAELAYGWEVFLSFALQVGAVGEAEALALWERVGEALRATARDQGEHLREADPVARALALLSGLLAQGRVYLEDLRRGGAPDADAAPLCGWQRRAFQGMHGEEETFTTKPGAVMVGYHVHEGGHDWACFLPDGTHEALQRAAQGQAGAALPDAGKLWGNMRDRLHSAGLMRCEAEAGGRVRATAKRKTPDSQRKHLLMLRLPLGDSYESVGTLGTLGTQGEESATTTAFNCVPNLNYFSYELGTLGTLGKEEAFSSSPVTPAPTPRALTLEDLEGYGEGEDLPGVVTL
ncbi:toprim domain-containing protein [Deinococcus sp. LM3]|uniref:toprim domain-containing protein n=1 Tax=Deinococcus sp. LM3 TaxID=1938608 RepID=UPI000994636B|nr:toprim domain-containing protein [Deinococcus sp. LM3]OOV15231.1 hypothetical protein BXU09_11810 [Deinococcus sp. LM3]